MTRVINVTLDPSSIDRAIRELRDYKQWLQTKANELAERLANMGAPNVSLGYARAFYQGDRNVDVTVEQRSENTFAIVAGGESVLFLEFGAGIKYGYGHPQNGQFGYGPGTYPGKGHWNDPRGWHIPGSGERTYGNPPSMAMYTTARDLRNSIQEVAREVFRK